MTPRLDAVLVAILEHWRQYSVPPTIRFVRDRVGVPSSSTVHYYYRQLVKANQIILSGGPGANKPVPVLLVKIIKESLNDRETITTEHSGQAG